jgi:NAD(P)-dependent dehydrogenase (short-subunit alcohol dehydrogenase family)
VSWSPADIPSQDDRTALVTGVSVGGLGHHTALELARAGARVVLAGRSPAKLHETAATIRDEVPGAELEQLVVDLADLSSVRAAGEEAAAYGPLDLLVNNAGIMATPYRRTVDDLESQLATNHFGPFLLTGLLLPRLAEDGRVVTVSSQMHRVAHRAPLGDPHAAPRPYLRWIAYAQTKLANLLFTFELDRRLRAAGSSVSAHAAHPGYAGTHLVVNGRFGRSTGGIASILDAANRAVSQSPAIGAWPTLMAATADLPGSTYCGPSGLGEAAGPPQLVGWSRLAGDRDTQRALWELSEETTGIAYP